MKFDSTYQQGPGLSSYREGTIKNEPMIFSADLEFALYNGGPITHEFVTKLSESLDKKEKKDLIIDSKVCMLMPGWYPCIPGWHHDDVARTRSDKQPNYEDTTAFQAKHAMAIVEESYKGPDSRTQFLCGEIDLPIPGIGKIVYKEWNDKINEILAHPKKYKDIYVNVHSFTHNQIFWFDSFSFHRGMPARQTGWRFFIRASWNTKRKPLNEIRRNAQVYMAALEAGW